MKNLILVLTALTMLFFTGCGNLSPRNEGRSSPRIGGKNNKVGKLESDVKNLQGSMAAELGNIRADNKIMAEKLDSMQQGNFNTKKDNSGVQILSGDGGLVLVLALGVMSAGAICILLYYKDKSEKAEKALNVMAQKVAEINDPTLEDNIYGTALHSGAEKEVLSAIKKFKH